MAKKEVPEPAAGQQERINYSEMAKFKLCLFSKAYQALKKIPAPDAFHEFSQLNSYWLEDLLCTWS